MADLFGYSERGLVNALYETIVSHANANGLLEGLLRTCAKAGKHGQVVRFTLQKAIEDFDVYVEPSLSSFGNPDVVLIVKYKDGETATFFVEAKIEGFVQNSPPPYGDTDVGATGSQNRYRANASSILHELYLKARFDQILRHCSSSRRPLHGVSAYVTDKTTRGIGSDSLVGALVEEIWQTDHSHFLAMTTDLVPKGYSSGRPWLAGIAIGQAIAGITRTNDPYCAHRNPYSAWSDETYVLSWHSVRAFAEAHGLDRVCREIGRNISKFRFPSAFSDVAGDDERALGVRAENLLLDWIGPTECRVAERSGGRRTLYVGRLAFITYDVYQSFDGPKLHAYMVRRKTKRKSDVLAVSRACVVSLNEIEKRVGDGFAWLEQALGTHPRK